MPVDGSPEPVWIACSICGNASSNFPALISSLPFLCVRTRETGIKRYGAIERGERRIRFTPCAVYKGFSVMR